MLDSAPNPDTLPQRSGAPVRGEEPGVSQEGESRTAHIQGLTHQPGVTDGLAWLKREVQVGWGWQMPLSQSSERAGPRGGI